MTLLYLKNDEKWAKFFQVGFFSGVYFYLYIIYKVKHNGIEIAS